MSVSPDFATIHLMNIKIIIALLTLVPNVGFAKAPALTSSPVHVYTCDGGKKISATYLSYESDGPGFVVLMWNRQEYGLAQAVSADGGRYASLYGPTMGGNGLEWWEAQGSATLSTFTSSDTSQKRTLLTNCRAR